MTSKFIVIEGIDGTGKTTLAKRLQNTLELETGERFSVTREPVSSQLESTIRSIFKDPRGLPPPEQMAVLFTADRLLHLRETVLPRMADGVSVICDRHKLSTLVYQTINGCSEDVLNVLNSVPCPEPDLTILLDIDPVVARKRMVARNPKLDNYESDLERQHKCRELYLKNVHKWTGGHAVVNADCSEDELVERVTRITVGHFRAAKLLGENLCLT